MKRIIFFAAFLAMSPAVVIAQDEAATGSIAPPGVTDDDTRTATPVQDEKRFSESQVRSKLAEAGYTGIGSLNLDSNGVWRTTAIKGDTLVSVGLDDQGNIIEK